MQTTDPGKTQAGLLVVVLGHEGVGGAVDRVQLLFVDCQDSINLSGTGEGELRETQPSKPSDLACFCFNLPRHTWVSSPSHSGVMNSLPQSHSPFIILKAAII